MDEKRRIEVSDWYYEPPAPRIPLSTTACRARIPARLLGIMGSLLLHGLVVQTIVLGTSTRKVSSPVTQVLPSTANAGGAASEMSLVVVRPMDATTSTDSLFEEYTSRGAILRETPIALLNPDPTSSLNYQAEPLADAESPSSTGDAAESAHLFGIYSGQISARIERAWRRPRTPVNDPRLASRGPKDDAPFRCQVQIIQDANGAVKEILLPACNGSAAWQRSLVSAIHQSSPLPPPPSPTVFTNALTMIFTGYAYTPNSAPDEYEIEMPHPLANTLLPASKAVASRP